jgi:hypothetical protein
LANGVTGPNVNSVPAEQKVGPDWLADERCSHFNPGRFAGAT